MKVEVIGRSTLFTFRTKHLVVTNTSRYQLFPACDLIESISLNLHRCCGVLGMCVVDVREPLLYLLIDEL